MIFVDPPTWPGHGRLWSHLISDSSYDELHAFARAVGIPVRGFERDHYDVPAELYEQVVAAGAVPVSSRRSFAGWTRRGSGSGSAASEQAEFRVEVAPRGLLPPRARGCRVEERITRGEPLQNGDPAGPELLVRDVPILLAYRSSVGRIRVRVCAQDGEVGVAQHGTVSVGRRRLVRCRQLDETNDLGDLLGFDAECRRMDAASSALVRSSSPGRPL